MTRPGDDGGPPPVDDFASSVLDVVDSIPPGRVMSYGDIAEYVGQGGPRQVGQVMALWGGGVPWWRVVRADGALAKGGRQKRGLVAEGQNPLHVAAERLKADGVDVLTGHRAVRCEQEGEHKFIVVEHGGKTRRIEFDVLICAVGRTSSEAYLERYGTGLNAPQMVHSSKKGRECRTSTEYVNARLPPVPTRRRASFQSPVAKSSVSPRLTARPSGRADASSAARSEYNPLRSATRTR